MAELREALPKDMAGVMALEWACYNAFTRESEAVYRERLRVFPAGFLVLETEGRIAGALSSELWDAETLGMARAAQPELFALGHSISARHRSGGTALYISSLAVSPAYRKRGFGGLLFNGLLERTGRAFPRVAGAVLLVNEDWEPARRLYARAGFTETARLPGFFRGDKGEKQDGVIMEKRILV
jgi:ribosomal-protein-alanine N-acetyltransferase